MRTEIKSGDTLKNICCQNFEWEIIIKIVDWWGVCQNPDCPVEAGTCYQGVDHFDTAELEERVSEKVCSNR